MWAVVASALAARRGQALVVALVALLASAAVAVAPWYAVAATQQVGVAVMSATPVPDRLISITRLAGSGEAAGADLRDQLRRQFAPAGFTPVFGGFVPVELRPDAGAAEVRLAYREDVCAHLLVTGACPAAAGEVLVPATSTEAFTAEDEIEVIEFGERAGTVRVVGAYQVADPTDPYWASGELINPGAESGDEPATVFTSSGSLAGYQRVTHTYELIAIPDAFAAIDIEELTSALAADLAELQAQRYSVSTTGLDEATGLVAEDRRNLTASVGVGVAVLLLFTWFVLIVVLREAVIRIRGDVGWWRLHGAPAGRGWVAALSQSAAPLVAGGLLGGAAGVAAGRELAGTIEGADPRRTALLLALLLIGLTLAGGLVAVVATQLRSLRTPVRDLLRRVPGRQPSPGRRVRRSMLDLVLVMLAAVAVGQALWVGRDPVGAPDGGRSAGASGLVLLAPGLAVLAIALVAAWAVSPLVTRLAGHALRAGRLAVTLVAASVARRPGTHRLVALVAVAVGLLVMALVGWDASARDQRQRAALETGADRVVTVAAPDSARLLAAVRAVDPTGTHAMAVVHRNRAGEHPPVLAVDSTRLAAVVAGWRAEYGESADRIAAALRPADPEPVVLAGGRLELTATGQGPAGTPVHLRALLRTTGTGEPVEAVVGPLAAEPGALAADLPACTGGCRLVGLQLLGAELAGAAEGGPAEYLPPSGGTRVELYRLAGTGTGTDPAAVLEPARWRPALGPAELGPVITAGDGSGLRLTVPVRSGGAPLTRNDWVFTADVPLPLPVVRAGWRTDPTGELRLPPLAGAAVPVALAGTVSLLPRLGPAGVLVDLEYAERMAPFPVAGGAAQVWLSGTAPSSIVDELRAAGLPVLAEESRSGRLGVLGAEGSAVGARFQLAVAVVALLLTTGAVLVLASEERTGRAGELAALAAQGVPPGVVRAVGYGGLLAAVGTATGVGLVAGIAGAGVARFLDPGFIDGWEVLPASSLHPYPAVAGVAAAAVALGGVVLVAATGLVRRTREQLP